MRTIAVDFDGVLHSYSSPWVDQYTIPDPPNPGAIDFLRELSQHYRVVIFTTRAIDVLAVAHLGKWLIKHGLESDIVNKIEASNRKGDASLYIDDRAFRFEGRFPSMGEIEALADPWWKK